MDSVKVWASECLWVSWDAQSLPATWSRTTTKSDTETGIPWLARGCSKDVSVWLWYDMERSGVMSTQRRLPSTQFLPSQCTLHKKTWSIAIGGVRIVAASLIGGRPTGCRLCSSVPVPIEQRRSKRTRCHKVYVRIWSTHSSCWRTNRRMVDSPSQSIVTGLHERSRKGIMDGLRSFIEMDNRSAVDVGHLRRSTRPFYFYA